ncbi:MAG TPA: hypothetical protein VLS89_15925 [Candidatus Nanopelagicales bacterium]|nr:hypothetical protein [Candidatus Nanopelagicales bacterium]
MNDRVVEELERYWEPDEGVFWRLREGVLDPRGLEEVAARLDSIEVSEDALLPRRFVSLVWFIPLFVGWQRDRVRERGGDMQEFAKQQNRLEGAVQRLLGVP